MRWEKGRRSSNVEDRRGQTPRMAAGGGGAAFLLIRLLPFLLRGRFGRYFLLIAGLAIGAHMLGFINLPSLLGQLAGVNLSAPGADPNQPRSAVENELADFTSVVLADTEDTWTPLFAGMGQRYRAPTLVMFTGSVQSACGFGQAAMGPFYCPGDEKIYIDLSFYDDLRQRHGAPGDFAQAYVIAHEVGHHVQTLLGVSSDVQARSRGLSADETNELSVRQELQADCYAGVWANHANTTRQVLEVGDFEEAIAAAESIGDDRLQREAQGYVVPESFTHGTSAQRMRWFTTGFETGAVAACDTFQGNAF
jgi:predicted metalloprotease